MMRTPTARWKDDLEKVVSIYWMQVTCNFLGRLWGRPKFNYLTADNKE